MKIVFILSCCFREYSFKHVSLPVADWESVERRSTTEDVLESRRTGGAKMATHTSTKSTLRHFILYFFKTHTQHKYTSYTSISNMNI